MRIVIVEDEKRTANDLAKTLISIDSEIDIVAVLHSVEESLLYFKNKPTIDLIFSDIELSDGLSFEFFKTLKIDTPVVFCTAYNQYALEAFQTFGIDYVLKPFNREVIEKTLVKFQMLKEKLKSAKNDYEEILDALKQNRNVKTQSIIVTQGDKLIPIKGQDIAVFYIENDLTFVYTFEQKKGHINFLGIRQKVFPF